MAERVRHVLNQGLRCVQFRVPRQKDFSPMGFELALGLRYGLIGVAAAHHLTLSVDPEDESSLTAQLSTWSDLVEDHVRQFIVPNLQEEPRDAFSIVVAEHAQKPLSAYLALHQQLFPFEYYLEIVLSLFTKAHAHELVSDVSLLRRRRARRVSRDAARASVEFALRFFERREAQLEEVPEIVLLGE